MTNSAACQKKYIREYFKRNLLLIGFCTLICAIPFFIAALMNDVIKNDMLLCVFTIIFGVVIFGVSMLYVIRFKKMIARQEELLGVTFNDNNACAIDNFCDYISDDWFIRSGSVAFHRRYIRSIEVEGESSPRSFRLTIRTIDDRVYGFSSMINTKELKRWWKNNEESLFY